MDNELDSEEDDEIRRRILEQTWEQTREQLRHAERHFRRLRPGIGPEKYKLFHELLEHNEQGVAWQELYDLASSNGVYNELDDNWPGRQVKFMACMLKAANLML